RMRQSERLRNPAETKHRVKRSRGRNTYHHDPMTRSTSSRPRSCAACRGGKRPAAVTTASRGGSDAEAAGSQAIVLEITLSSRLNAECVHRLRQALCTICGASPRRVGHQYADICVAAHLDCTNQQKEQQRRQQSQLDKALPRL